MLKVFQFITVYEQRAAQVAHVTLQDKVDDAQVGIKSTALLFGSRTKAWLSGFAALNVGLLCLTGAPRLLHLTQKVMKRQHECHTHGST